MSGLLSIAAITLIKREHPRLVAATGLIFQKLGEITDNCDLKDVLESHRGGVWGEEVAPGLGYPVIRSTNMRGVRVNTEDVTWCDIPPAQAEVCALQSGDILVAKSSGSSDLVGKATLFVHPRNDNTYLFSNFTLRLRPNDKVVLPEFVAWFLRSPQSLMWRYRTQQNAVGLRNLRTKEFLAQNIPVPELQIQKTIVTFLNALEERNGAMIDTELPPPLSEQQRIVARIEELAAKIEEARKLREAINVERDAIFSSLLNEIWGDQREWTERPLGEIATTVRGQVDPRVEPFASLPYINGESIEPATCRLLPNYRAAKVDGVTSGKYYFKAKSILYSKIRPYLRKAVQVPFDGVCSADIYAFDSIAPELDPRFFMYSLITPEFTEYANSISGRTRIPKLNQDQLFAFNLSFPSIVEQRRIVAYLDNLQSKVDALKHLQAETFEELDALLPSILDKAFKGELD